jgi:hypothetical protein
VLSTGTFLDRIKLPEIKPIYKKGDKTLTTNYSPISLHPVLSKIFKNILYKRVYHHLTSNSTFIKQQFAFRCNNSIKIAIYALANNILHIIISKLHNKRQWLFFYSKKLWTV